MGRFIYRKQLAVGSRQKMIQWAAGLEGKTIQYLPDASYDIFTYHGEDGIIYYLLQQMKGVPQVFVDIGAGDCIKGNCANLATHFGWKGLFLDADGAQLAVGMNFYKHKMNQGVIKMVHSEVTPANVNTLLDEPLLKNGVGLLSIDIDGNDYWVWKAVEAIQPRLVVIEAKVEFGYKNIIVPYGETNHRSVDEEYNGASLEALRILGEKKGYKLVGAIADGYNLFFVRKDEDIPPASVPDILDDPIAGVMGYGESFFTSHNFVTE